MKHLFSIILLLTLFGTATAQTPSADKQAAVVIQSSVICDMCEKTIEENLIYEKGVKKVEVDLATASVSVQYDPRKTDVSKLRTALIGLGYAADGKAGDAKAFAKLPQCCQKEGCGKLPEKP